MSDLKKTDIQADDSSHNLIYGCMNIGGNWEDREASADERKAAFLSLDAAFEAGFRRFDHADIYCRGKSESLFGEYLAAHPEISREEIIIQSKTGIRFAGDPNPDSPGRYDFGAHYVLSQVDKILARLGCEYLDVLLFHRPDALVEGEEFAEACHKLFTSGKVRRFGVSNHSAARIRYLQSYVDQPIEINQLEFSLGHRALVEAEILTNQDADGAICQAAGLLDYCRSNGISLQAWSPLARGRFTGNAGADDSIAFETKAYLDALAVKKQCSPEALALAWICRIPASLTPVVGSTNPDRIHACAQAANAVLSREEWYTLLTLARGQALP